MRSRKSQHNTLSEDLSSARKMQEAGKQKKQHDKLMANFFHDYIDNLLVDAHNSLGMCYGSADFTRDRDYVKRRITHEGVSFIVDVLPSFMGDLLSMLEDGSTFSTRWKKQKRVGRPAFLRRLTEVTMNEKNYNAKTRAMALTFIYNVSVCGKKYRATPSEQCVQAQWDDFLKVDEFIGDINFDDSELEAIISSASTQWQSLFGELSLDDDACIPRPGPGATVGNIKKSLRYAPQTMFKQLDDVFPYEDWFFSHPWDVVDKSRSFLDMKKKSVKYPHSEYLLVPKTYRKWRGICKEANEVQFLQQALRRLLNSAIESESSLPLKDQSVHALRALEASITREDATIDESEASDRIARILVGKVGSSTPDLTRALMAVSTKWILSPRGTDCEGFVGTHKFAPMGSAICFPVMSVIHLFLIRGIILTKMLDISFAERARLCKRVSVYGDDIILPTPAVALVYEWLPKFGIKINQTKSFRTSFFRESCGCHAYLGHDVTPVYIKYTTFSSSDDGDTKKLLSLLSVEQQLFKRGFLATAEFLRDHIEAKWGWLPYVSDVTPLVGFKRPPFHECLTDFSQSPRKYSQRWDRFTHQPMFRLMTFGVDSEKGAIPDDSQALLRYHCVKPQRDLSIRAGTFFASLRMDEWVKRLEDKTIRLYMAVVPTALSALFGHPCENWGSCALKL